MGSWRRQRRALSEWGGVLGRYAIPESRICVSIAGLVGSRWVDVPEKVEVANPACGDTLRLAVRFADDRAAEVPAWHVRMRTL